MEDPRGRIERLDIGLFAHAPSQSTDDDRRSLLALEAAMGRDRQFVYLEIGSYLGGSLQPYLVDPRCLRIVSIDSRPYSLPDERGGRLSYPLNTTQNMLDALKSVPGADFTKLVTLERGTEVLKASELPVRPDLCFVDGEHTDGAVLRDARFCLEAVRDNGCIAFHDANIVYRGIAAFLEDLKRANRPSRAFHLPDALVFVELDGCGMSRDESVRAQLDRNFDGYLWSLIANDPYRAYYNLPLLRLFRRAKASTFDRAMRLARRMAPRG